MNQIVDFKPPLFLCKFFICYIFWEEVFMRETRIDGKKLSELLMGITEKNFEKEVEKIAQSVERKMTQVGPNPICPTRCNRFFNFLFRRRRFFL